MFYWVSVPNKYGHTFAVHFQWVSPGISVASINLRRPDRKGLGKCVIKIMENAAAVFRKRQFGLLNTSWGTSRCCRPWLPSGSPISHSLCPLSVAVYHVRGWHSRGHKWSNFLDMQNVQQLQESNATATATATVAVTSIVAAAAAVVNFRIFNSP